jgi:outer membrane protein OmpA-like peptidoglycan-associated protein
VSEKRLKALAALVGVGILVVIAAGAAFGSQAAADDLQTRAEHALAAADLDGVHVAFHGREAELSDGTPDELGRAELIVEGIDGVRWADIVQPTGDSTTSQPRDTTPTLDLGRTAGGIRISGTVPDADAAAGIKARTAEVFGVPVTGDLVIDPAVGSASWVSRLPDVFGDVVGVKGLALRIDGTGTLGISGSIESEAGADDVRRLVAAAVPDLEVVGHLDVQPGDLSEADAAVLNSSTLYFGSGSSALDAGGKRVLDVVADVLQRNARVSIEVGGHAGPKDPAAGERLSIARVAAVKTYLVRAGVNSDRISTRSFASDSGTATSLSAKQYRRVDFVVKET